MPQGRYLPEGMLLDTAENKAYTGSVEGMEKAISDHAILEGKVILCDAAHNLLVDVNGKQGIIKRRETALGIDTGKTREIAIISRVGKAVCFKAVGVENGIYQLSRRLAQQEAEEYFFEAMKPGEVMRAKVTHLEPFGAFVDIGCGIISLIGIENISVSRISHPSDRFYSKQEIYAVLLQKDLQARRMVMSHRELLGTWEDNAKMLTPGETVGGIVRGIEEYGIFVELAPNLSGLAERRDGMVAGMPVAVYIKSVIPERMKIKLVIIDALESQSKVFISEKDYFIRSGRLLKWQYTPDQCSTKRIETVFT